mgnify:CR=1 FL=1
MYRIVERQDLTPDIHLFKIEAPAVARKALPGQFVILRAHEKGERIPLTVADYDPLDLQGLFEWGYNMAASEIERQGRMTSRELGRIEGQYLAWIRGRDFIYCQEKRFLAASDCLGVHVFTAPDNSWALRFVTLDETGM